MKKRENSPPLSAAGRDFTLRLYEEYQGLMYATARKYLSDHAAEDAVQDSVVKLMEKAELLQTLDKHRLAGYVVSTVRNTAINLLKKQDTSEKRTSPEPDFSEVPDREISLDEMMILSERSRALITIWPKLPEETRSLLEGKYILNCTDEELAGPLHCKADSVRMKLTRARRLALQMILDEKGDEKT